MQQPVDLGRRVVIHGATGSGKTTLARRLSELLGVPVIQLDAIRHHRGWDSVDWDEMRAILTHRLDASPNGWVCEGNYSQVRDIYIARAESLVWLHLPWRVSFWRLFWRTISRAWSKDPPLPRRWPQRVLAPHLDVQEVNPLVVDKQSSQPR